MGQIDALPAYSAPLMRCLPAAGVLSTSGATADGSSRRAACQSVGSAPVPSPGARSWWRAVSHAAHVTFEHPWQRQDARRPSPAVRGHGHVWRKLRVALRIAMMARREFGGEEVGVHSG